MSQLTTCACHILQSAHYPERTQTQDKLIAVDRTAAADIYSTTVAAMHELLHYVDLRYTLQ